MLNGAYLDFYNDIIKVISEKNVYTKELHTIAYGTDASVYRYIPKIVIKANNQDDIKHILKFCNIHHVSLTFRAAGTSVSGQALSDSILVITSRDWTSFSISDDQSSISLSPSIIGSHANKSLSKYNKKIGPDPASINAAMIGGIAANNSSGMCCGVSQNSYKTVKSMKIIFYDGTMLDTSCKESKNSFLDTHENFVKNLNSYAKEVKNNKELKNKISKKFEIKNTMGYSLNALVDFDDVFDIIEHLIIGSEGTLGFINEITYYTVDDYKNRASALILFKNMKAACDAVTSLKISKEVNVDAVELMDRASIASVEDKIELKKYLKNLSKNTTALLIETKAKDESTLDKQIMDINILINDFEPTQHSQFCKKEEEYSIFWNMRKGLYPIVSALREKGTSLILEDVAFPIKDLAKGTLQLQELFSKYNFESSVLFGHALEGNIHSVFTHKFKTQDDIEHYDKFMNDFATLVVNLNGSLKAEHGTGRNMAAFVELEWGIEAYSMMIKIKKLFDPDNLLNPGVLINDDSKIHLRNLKKILPSNNNIDECVECGFCEQDCPSSVLTFTPRHRIAVNRAITDLQNQNKISEANELKKQAQYDSVDTCATCSLCSLSCPLDIDTSLLTKETRTNNITKTQDKNASFVVNNFSIILSIVKVTLYLVNILHTLIGTKYMMKLNNFLRIISFNKIPKFLSSLPKPANINTNIKSKKSKNKVVYFSSCINRVMGQAKNSQTKEMLFDISISLLQKANYEVIIPENIGNLCCGMPFSSKGYNKQAQKKSIELEISLLNATENGKYPILCDMSPCTKTMLENFTSNLDVYEPIEFSLKYLVNSLKINKSDEKILIHNTCSSTKMGLNDKFLKLAKLCTTEVIVPDNISCCGFAGDKGFVSPELNESALRNLKNSMDKDVKNAYSTSKTCEIGLKENSGIDYNSVLYLLDKCSSKLEKE